MAVKPTLAQMALMMAMSSPRTNYDTYPSAMTPAIVDSVPESLHLYQTSILHRLHDCPVLRMTHEASATKKFNERVNELGVKLRGEGNRNTRRRRDALRRLRRLYSYRD